MAVGGGGVSGLFWVPPGTAGNYAAWLQPGVLEDSGIPIGTGGMAIGGTVTGGTPGSVLFIDSGGNLGQDNAKFFWDNSGFSLELKGGSTLALGGSSSGTVTLATKAAAGTWTFTLPTTPGTNLYVLQTDGSGNTTWVPQSGGGGGMAIGGTVTGGTPGSVLFIDGSGDLAQDNANFFWDDTNFALKLGHSGTSAALYLDALPAIYSVPNGSGNNWFEGNAGNFTTTGFLNFGTGDGCLAGLTSGDSNTAIGANALEALTTGIHNTAMGSLALQRTQTDNYNFAFGNAALENLGTAGAGGGGNSRNTAIGDESMFTLVTGNDNIAIGYQTIGSGVTPGNAIGNVAIGYRAGYNLGSGSNAFSFNTLIGYSCGIGLNANSGNNTWLAWPGTASTTENFTIAISEGQFFLFDCNLSAHNIFSVGIPGAPGDPTAFHIYNTTDGTPPTNYERGILDWTTTSNVFTIGTPSSSAGGTGTVRETRLYTLGLPALYIVANGTGNNWFEGNAGNTSVSGYSNFATGDLSLHALTSGFQNTAIGSNVLQHCTTGSINTALGAFTLQNTQTDNDNFAFGQSTLTSLGTGGAGSGTNQSNVCMGSQVAYLMQTGAHNVGVGPNVMQQVTTGGAIGNVCVGSGAGRNIGSGAAGTSFNTFIGYTAGQNITGGSSYNTWIGDFAGYGSGAIAGTICISSSNGGFLFDFNYTYNNNVFSLSAPTGATTATGLHIYNATDLAATGSITNWERGILDWTLTSNVFRVGSQAGGTGTVRLIAIDGFQKAGAPAAGDLPSGTCALINDTSGGNTWLVYNNAGTIRKVQLT